MHSSPKRRVDEVDDKLEDISKVISSLSGHHKTYYESKLLCARLKKQKLIALHAYAQAQRIIGEMDTLIAENDLFNDIESLRECKIFKTTAREFEDLDETIVIDRIPRHSTPVRHKKEVHTTDKHLLDYVKKSTKINKQTSVGHSLDHQCSKIPKITNKKLSNVLGDQNAPKSTTSNGTSLHQFLANENNLIEAFKPREDTNKTQKQRDRRVKRKYVDTEKKNKLSKDYRELIHREKDSKIIDAEKAKPQNETLKIFVNSVLNKHDSRDKNMSDTKFNQDTFNMLKIYQKINTPDHYNACIQRSVPQK